MKKHVLILGLALMACTTGALAQQKTTPLTPPAPVDSAFQGKFSGTSATWMKTPGGNFCATMDNGGQKEHVEFSPDGKWLSTKTELVASSLPDSAKNAIQTQFPGMEIAAVQKLEYENINPFYKVDLKQGDQSKSVMVNNGGFIEQ